jgi:hypothetical protein
MVLSTQGEIIYSFQEETPGNTPDINEIFDACISQMPQETPEKFFFSFNG